MTEEERGQYQKDYAEFHAAIGEGITVWSNIEHQLAILLCIFTNSISPATLEAFYAIQAFSSKLKAVSAAAEVALSGDSLEPHLKNWKNFRNRLERLSRIRNKLAHYTIIFSGTKGGTEFSLGKPQIRIPNSHDRWVAHCQSEISLQQIKQYQAKCEKLFEDLMDFNNTFRRHINLALALSTPTRQPKQSS